MVAKNKSPRRRSARGEGVAPRSEAAPPRQGGKNRLAVDGVDLFSQKMRALHERDQALADVVRLRDAGKIRAAKARLRIAETLHARIDALDQAFAGRHRTKPENGR